MPDELRADEATTVENGEYVFRMPRVLITETMLRRMLLDARRHQDVTEDEAFAAILSEVQVRREQAIELRAALAGRMVAVVTPEGVRFAEPKPKLVTENL